MSWLAAVVFDFDGVLLDSETPEYESHRRIFERCGVRLTTDEWCDQIGLFTEGHDDRWFHELRARAAEPPGRDVYDAEKRRIFDEVVPNAPMRGVADLLTTLHAAAIPAAIASSSTASWVEPAVARLGITGFFRAIVTGEQVARRKPAPDLYLEAARRLNVDPARTVAVEDSGPGLAAARAAGMKTVVIPHWLTEGHDLNGADMRVAHAGELTVARLEALVGQSLDSPQADPRR
jgi:HAD superfamily hydrolase (TIGR01509 family)